MWASLAAGWRRNDPTGVVGGMAMMVLSTACMAAMYVGIRQVPGGMHPFEIAFFRNLFALLLLVAWHARSLPRLYRTQRLGLHFLRGLLNVVAMLMFFTAVLTTPLAEVSALTFTAPLFAALLAVVALREALRGRRVLALAAGFAGTLLVLKPGFAVLHSGHWLLLGSAALWGVTLMVIKVLARSDSSLTITVYMGTFLAPLSLLAALFEWQWPDLAQLSWMLGIAALGTVGQISLAQSFRLADASAVLPLDFFKLIWSALFGFVIFAEIPDLWTLLGGGIIFASATHLALREGREAVPARPAAQQEEDSP